MFAVSPAFMTATGGGGVPYVPQSQPITINLDESSYTPSSQPVTINLTEGA
jgi:hypothetical protein